MKKTITAKMNDDSYEQQVNEAINNLPQELQQRAIQAFRCEQKGDYDKAIDLCLQVLDKEDENTYYEVRMLLGRCYFAQRKPYMARQVFHDLVEDFPEQELPHMHLGFAYHMMSECQLAIEEFEKVYPLSSYHPFYYNSYGDCLQAVGKRKQSREIFYKEIEQYEKTGDIPSAEMLDGTYENVLYLDIVLGNGKYPEDLQSYYKFLDSIEMDENMQEHLAGTIVYLCGLLKNKWYRPLFLEFVEHIEAKGYLTMDDYKRTTESAHASVESYQYHEDWKISAFIEAYLCTAYEREYTIEDMPYEDMKKEIQVRGLTYEWYICEYYSGHEEEFVYIEKTYPYIWKIIRLFIEKMTSDRKSVQENILQELYALAELKEDMEDFRQYMKKAYGKALENKKEPAYVYDGYEPYERIQKKIGRNDPCPCGSGKKYKKCCGK